MSIFRHVLKGQNTSSLQCVMFFQYNTVPVSKNVVPVSSKNIFRFHKKTFYEGDTVCSFAIFSLLS